MNFKIGRQGTTGNFENEIKYFDIETIKKALEKHASCCMLSVNTSITIMTSVDNPGNSYCPHQAMKSTVHYIGTIRQVIGQRFVCFQVRTVHNSVTETESDQPQDDVNNLVFGK